jgi:hypothetical protein
MFKVLLTENSAPFSTRTFLKVSKVSFFSARAIINSAAIIKQRNVKTRHEHKSQEIILATLFTSHY